MYIYMMRTAEASALNGRNPPMNKFSRRRWALALIVAVPFFAHGQYTQKNDSSIVFKPSNPDFIVKSSFRPMVDAWGLDLFISDNGFGAGGFYRHEYTDEWSLLMSLAVSDVKDDQEVDQYSYDIYGNPTSFVPGKVNRLLLFPLTAGVQYRLFKDEIVDNFRPYISGGIGPTMIFVSPYAQTVQVPVGDGTYYPETQEVDFFTSLKYGKAHYTVGGYIGGGAFFGLDKGTLSGVSFRYYFVPFPEGIEVLEGSKVREFGGFFITLNFGSLY